MTMQTTSLPFQVSGANAPGQAQRQQAGAHDTDGSAFGATLSREIAQRQQAMAPTLAPTAAPTLAPASAPASAAPRPSTPARQAAGDKPQAADKQGAHASQSAAQDSGKAHAASGATAATAAAASADAGDAGDALRDALAAAAAPPATGAAVAADPAALDPAAAAAAADSAIAAAEAATTPVTDMLAFMASLTPPAAAVPLVAAPAAAPSFAPAPAVAAAAAGPDLQAAALQSAFARLGTPDAAATPADPALAAAGVEGDVAAAGGFQLSAGVQPALADTAGQPTQKPGAQASAQPAAQPDAAKLAAQARDAAAPAAAAVEVPAPSVTQLQAQVSKLETLANPAMAGGDRIPARVGSQAWDNQVSQRIVYMVGKEQAATLTLNPPDLGPVQVVLNVTNDGASVAFSSNQQEVRQALENAIPRLREMMSESGIALGNATVDAGVPDQRQAQQDGGERRNGGGFGNGNGPAAANDEAAARPATRTVALGDSGMVDTFA